MKWYIEYPIVYGCVLLIYLAWFTSPTDSLRVKLAISIIMSFFISAIGYAGYYEGRKKILMNQASKEEKSEILKKDRRINRILIWVIIVLIIFCTCIVGISIMIW